MTSSLTSRQSHQVREISPDRITSNPENPRLVFRKEEMDTLLLSIKKYGIQVPITVYEEDGNFILIDGERRWRCARKLNLKRVPALVQNKPTDLNNLLLMFNIHALREQWDYLTIASKLPKIIDLFALENDGQAPNEIELSELTGLTRGQIRRCRLLLDLPKNYRKILFAELDLPKQKQRLSEDFFIEMERSLKTVKKRIPTAFSDINVARDALISKYRAKVINNVVDLRKVSKIATSVASLDVERRRAEVALKSIFDPDNGVGINEVFEEQFETKYDEKKLVRNLESISNFLEEVEDDAVAIEEQPPEVLRLLRHLQGALNRLLRS
jgi:ParB family transcriptional regulator, chromosome partitioning protein